MAYLAKRRRWGEYYHDGSAIGFSVRRPEELRAAKALTCRYHNDDRLDAHLLDSNCLHHGQQKSAKRFLSYPDVSLQFWSAGVLGL